MKTATLTLTISLIAGTALADQVGLQVTTAHMPHHGRSTEMAVFYPTKDQDPTQLWAENPVFQGQEVQQDAAVAPGSHPVVLLSHGMGGNPRSIAWLAHGLAAEGAVVISVAHPNTTWRDFDLSKGIAHWTRALDLSRALDVVLDDPDFSDTLDLDRVMAAGFSYGGWTALSLGGARGNQAGLLSACAENPDIFLCEDIMGDLNVAGFAPEDWNDSYADPRVTSVFAIEPGFVWGPQAQDLAQMVDQVTLIGLGAGADRLNATDFEASGFEQLLPDAQAHWIAPGVHFTAMPLCKPAGAAILAAEADDPVCTDPEGTDRAQVHAQIIAMAAQQLSL